MGDDESAMNGQKHNTEGEDTSQTAGCSAADGKYERENTSHFNQAKDRGTPPVSPPVSKASRLSRHKCDHEHIHNQLIQLAFRHEGNFLLRDRPHHGRTPSGIGGGHQKDVLFC